MKAAYWTAIGAMLIPVGVAVLLSNPNMGTLATWLMIAGFASFIAGWGYTIREEHRNTEKEKEAKTNRLIEDKKRSREHRATMLILANIAESQGVNMRKVARTLKRWAEEEKESEDEEDLYDK